MNFRNIKIILSFVILLSFDLSVHAVDNETQIERSYALSTASMVELVQMEQTILKNLEKYQQQVPDKLQLTKKISTYLKSEYAKSYKDLEAFVSNPLNAYSLLRRLHRDWKKWNEYVRQKIGCSRVDLIGELHSKLPTAKDLDEASAGIIRLQETYQMKVEDIVDGILFGKQYDGSLDLQDCYAVAEYCLKNLDYQKALDWLHEAVQIHTPCSESTNKILGIELADVWYLIADTWFKIDQFDQALSAINLALKNRPNDAKFLKFHNNVERLHMHEKLCRGVIIPNSELFCLYNTVTNPFLQLAPLKMEIIAEDPLLVLYHDALYDHEIDELKSLSIPKLERELLIESDNAANELEHTAQRAEFFGNESRVVERMEQLTADMIGLDDFSPGLQVMNYGMGVDYLNNNERFDLHSKWLMPNIDKMASVLFYLSDVKLGGETIFTKLGIAVPPKKGAALIWNDPEDPKALHDSCPVILGSKWVATKLIYQPKQVDLEPSLQMQNKSA